MASKTALILIVDDDPGVRETLADFLDTEGYATAQADSIAAARTLLAAQPPELILLDLSLPGGDGLSFAAELRAVSQTPIIIISGKGAMVDRVVGLELGADDYLAKPFELRELLARVRAVLRRVRPSGEGASPPPDPTGQTSGRVARFDAFRLDPQRRQVCAASGQVVELSGAEFNLLALLAERPNRVLSRDAIAEVLHHGQVGGFDRSIDTLVSRLRKKLDSHTEDAARLIQTVRGEGYVLAASVEWSGTKVA